MSSYAENLRELAATGMMNTTVLRGAADEIDEAWTVADDLAAVLVYVQENSGRCLCDECVPDIPSVLARYREARQR